MIKINLQYFGGRGSGGGRRLSVSEAREAVSKTVSKSSKAKKGEFERETPENTKMLNAFEKTLPTGTYRTSDGDEYDISYKRANEHATELYVDGHSVVKMYQQYSGEYRVEDYTTGKTTVHKSASAAAKYVRNSWGTELKRVKKK